MVLSPPLRRDHTAKNCNFQHSSASRPHSLTAPASSVGGAFCWLRFDGTRFAFLDRPVILMFRSARRGRTRAETLTGVTRRYRNFALFVRQTSERKAQTCAIGMLR